MVHWGRPKRRPRWRRQHKQTPAGVAARDGWTRKSRHNQVEMDRTTSPLADDVQCSKIWQQPPRCLQYQCHDAAGLPDCRRPIERGQSRPRGPSDRNRYSPDIHYFFHFKLQTSNFKLHRCVGRSPAR
eukprot:scaffold25777_cov27-Phaeocystis_antarctica.AAC.1